MLVITLRAKGLFGTIQSSFLLIPTSLYIAKFITKILTWKAYVHFKEEKRQHQINHIFVQGHTEACGRVRDSILCSSCSLVLFADYSVPGTTLVAQHQALLQKSLAFFPMEKLMVSPWRTNPLPAFRKTINSVNILWF